MRVAIYTLTRDRLEYTKRSFQSLKGGAGCEYDHFVVDNGSEDGTPEWLHDHQDEFKGVALVKENLGISAGANLALDMIRDAGPYDLIFKVDNDCIFLGKDIIAGLVQVFTLKSRKQQLMLSPRVVGLNKQPLRRTSTRFSGIRVGWVSQVGGLCHAAPGWLYQRFRYNEHLPKAWGQDEQLCTWMISHGVKIGYVEDLLVEHCETTNGQVERYPEYFARKWREEEYEATSPGKD